MSEEKEHRQTDRQTDTAERVFFALFWFFFRVVLLGKAGAMNY